MQGQSKFSSATCPWQLLRTPAQSCPNQGEGSGLSRGTFDPPPAPRLWSSLCPAPIPPAQPPGLTLAPIFPVAPRGPRCPLGPWNRETVCPPRGHSPAPRGSPHPTATPIHSHQQATNGPRHSHLAPEMGKKRGQTPCQTLPQGASTPFDSRRVLFRLAVPFFQRVPAKGGGEEQRPV